MFGAGFLCIILLTHYISQAALSLLSLSLSHLIYDLFIFACVFVLILEPRQGFFVALEPVFGTSLSLASKSQRSTCLFQTWNPSLWMLSSCWVQKLPHKQFPETTWWESNDLFWWQGLDMHICCSLVGAGKNYLLAEVGRLLNSVIFGFLRKKQNKKPLLCFISHFNWIFFETGPVFLFMLQTNYFTAWSRTSFWTLLLQIQSYKKN